MTILVGAWATRILICTLTRLQSLVIGLYYQESKPNT